jgi:hypothetical protein
MVIRFGMSSFTLSSVSRVCFVRRSIQISSRVRIELIHPDQSLARSHPISMFVSALTFSAAVTDDSALSDQRCLCWTTPERQAPRPPQFLPLFEQPGHARETSKSRQKEGAGREAASREEATTAMCEESDELLPSIKISVVLL